MPVLRAKAKGEFDILRWWYLFTLDIVAQSHERPIVLDGSNQLEVFPTCLHLRRVDPARNMRRFYRLMVQRDLFGGANLVRVWGRIGTRGQEMIERHDDEGLAISALMKLAQMKRRRGYEL